MLIVHRARYPGPDLIVDKVRTVPPEWAITASWPLLSGSAQRAPAIVAIRNRLVSVGDLEHALTTSTRLPGRGELRLLIERIAGGCRSELELWGYLRVFDVPGLRHARRQLPVRAAGRLRLLDMAYPEEMVAIELDGRAYHASPEQWERDIRRDLRLATIGWQTVRLSHDRLTRDVQGCRRDVLAVLAARRRWRRSG